MNTIVTALSIIGAILIICIIILVHEFGHYSIGRACKIKIVEFAVGFGPKIKSWVKNGIIYSIRWLPLGGFTKFYGEDEESDAKLAFNNQPAGRRALAIAAGPVYNIIFAILLVAVLLCSYDSSSPYIAYVWPDSTAEAAGLQAGDEIIEMNGVKTNFMLDYSYANTKSDKKTLNITVQRGSEVIPLKIPYHYYENYTNEYLTGLGSNTLLTGYYTGLSINGQHLGFFEAVIQSFGWIFTYIKYTLIGLLGIMKTGDTSDISSIVGVTVGLGRAIQYSFEYVLELGAAISASLAIFNLLPLPALDGGRLIFIGIEKVFRKPVPRNVEGIIHFIGFALLMLIGIIFIYKDVVRGFGP